MAGEKKKVCKTGRAKNKREIGRLLGGGTQTVTTVIMAEGKWKRKRLETWMTKRQGRRRSLLREQWQVLRWRGRVK